MTLLNRFLAISILATVLIGVAGCQKQASTLPEGYGVYKGKWIVVNYWAEWCRPCLREIPELNKLAKDYADQVVVLAVNFDEITGEELVVLHQKMGIEYPAAPVDPKHFYQFKTPTALPTTLLIKPDGTMQGLELGEQTEHELLALMGLGS